MELRALRYLQTLALEGSVSNAAKSLHITQPTLSRQLSALEAELGCELFERSYRGMSLNDNGMMLLRYADSILELVEKAECDLSPSGSTVAGPIYIGAGETMNMVYIARAMELLRCEHPGIDLRLSSGSTVDLMDGFVRGAYDFLIECEVGSHVEANVLDLPIQDRWGVLVKRGSELAERDSFTPVDLIGREVILPRQALGNSTLRKWAGDALDQCTVVAQFSLPLNAALISRCNYVPMLTYEGLFEVSDDSDMTFIPLSPELRSKQGLLWRKIRLSRQAELFLEALKCAIAEQ